MKHDSVAVYGRYAILKIILAVYGVLLAPLIIIAALVAVFGKVTQ